jgi:transposase
VSKWKKELLINLPALFSDKRKAENKDHEELEAELYKQIGQLKVELEWLKKKSDLLS